MLLIYVLDVNRLESSLFKQTLVKLCEHCLPWKYFCTSYSLKTVYFLE